MEETKQKHIYLSIVVPAYNEEKRLPESLHKLKNYADKLGKPYEILVVDDGSTDNTARVAQELAFVHVIKQPHNMGKGAAVKTGMLVAKGDLRLFSDADSSTPITELDKFLPHSKEYDIIIGSRALKDSDIKLHQPWYRELMGKTFNKIVRIIAVGGIHDTQCGFKLFSKKAADMIFPKQTIDRWGFDVEVLYLAKKYGFQVKEIPVVWINDTASKVRPIVDAYKMLTEVLKVRMNAIRGKY